MMVPNRLRLLHDVRIIEMSQSTSYRQRQALIPNGFDYNEHTLQIDKIV